MNSSRPTDSPIPSDPSDTTRKDPWLSEPADAADSLIADPTPGGKTATESRPSPLPDADPPDAVKSAKPEAGAKPAASVPAAKAKTPAGTPIARAAPKEPKAPPEPNQPARPPDVEGPPSTFGRTRSGAPGGFEHGQPRRTAVLLTNLGSPDEPTKAAVKEYLKEFLSDQRVVEIAKIAWLPVLHGVVLRNRPADSAVRYQSIWTEEGSPLKVWTEKQAAGLQAALRERGHHVTVASAMRYGSPSIAQVLDQLVAEGATRVLVLPAYPQYSAATTASAADAVFAWGQKQRRLPELRFVNGYCDDPNYIGALAETVRRHWAEHGQPQRVLMSFHGMPERTLHLGDPYHCECRKTARLLAETLGLADDQYQVTFQSKFGRAKWLEPATQPTLVALGQAGIQRVDVICPGFASDCLETLEEIAIEGRQAFIDAGGKKFHYIPCLNDDADWIAALGHLAERHLAGWSTLAPVDGGELAASRARAMAAGAAQ